MLKTIFLVCNARELHDVMSIEPAFLLSSHLSIKVSAVMAFYGTVVFSLISIYAKTALGMGMTTEYLTFFEKLGPYRMWGFRSFIGTVVLYNISWVLSLALNYEGRIRWWLVLPALVAGSISLVHMTSIVGLASTMLYS